MTVISKDLILGQFTKDTNGRVVSVNANLFKFVNQSEMIVIKKVNLEDLFGTKVIPAGKIYTTAKVDVTDAVAVFQAWVEYFGIDDLSAHEVVLSGDVGIVNVEITMSAIYTGTLVLKTK